jgi:hypothetical protein
MFVLLVLRLRYCYILGAKNAIVLLSTNSSVASYVALASVKDNEVFWDNVLCSSCKN